MGKTLIICEGVTDLFFICHCMDRFFGYTFDQTYNSKKPLKEFNFHNGCTVLEIGGCENITNPIVIDRLLDNQAEGGKNIIIFDSDFGPESTSEKKGTGNNGFGNAIRKLEDLKKTKQVDFQYYLWHDHENDGEIEDLLEGLIPSEKQPLLECITTHKKCLSSLAMENIQLPDKKNILNFYIHLLNCDNHNYGNVDIWNLNKDDNQLLMKFYHFLEEHLIIKTQVPTY
jgi:hypothetical protein